MMRCNHVVFVMLASALGLVLALGLGGPAAGQSTSTTDPVAMAESLRGSLVRVEYTLRYDKGQAPNGAGMMGRCPSCGEYHIETGDDAVKEERPLEAAGYLIAPDRVLTSDLFLHPRFIEKTEVVLGGERVAAAPVAYASDQHALILQLTRPLKQGQVLRFDSSKAGSYSIVNYSLLNGEWTTMVSPLSLGSVLVSDAGARFTPVSEYGVIVAEDGTPVGMNMTGELAPGGTWKGSPEKWSWLSMAPYEARIAKVQAAADGGVLRARLDLRSPRVTGSGGYSPYDYYSDSGDSEATEIDALALLVDDRRVVVLSLLKPSVTARLESITIFPPGSEEGVGATFTATLRDYGAFIATLDEPVEGALSLSRRDVRSYRNQMLIGAEITLQGENRIAYFTHDRVSSFNIGWKRHVYPNVSGPDASLFLFDDDEALVGFPIARRERLGAEDRWSESYPALTSAGQMAEVLADVDANADTSNVPLTEEEENRTAWLGVIMQGLDTELARQMGVSELSQDGAIGGLVTFVYPDSPAAAAGIEDGDVLLRVHAAELPKPVDVEVDESDQYGGAFPWARLDELTEEYFDMIPAPWPKVNNAFNKRLSTIGYGTPIKLEYVRDGQVIMADMSITQSPVHYDAAPQYKSEALGLTVRPMTYDVRRYFQKSESDPGVIVAHIEAGSKASVVGIKPFEIITAVNDQPVFTNDDFRKAIVGQSELRLSMLRMTRTRLVKITLDEPIEDDAGDDEGAPADPMDGG